MLLLCEDGWCCCCVRMVGVVEVCCVKGVKRSCFACVQLKRLFAYDYILFSQFVYLISFFYSISLLLFEVFF